MELHLYPAACILHAPSFIPSHPPFPTEVNEAAQFRPQRGESCLSAACGARSFPSAIPWVPRVLRPCRCGGKSVAWSVNGAGARGILSRRCNEAAQMHTTLFGAFAVIKKRENEK